MMNIISEEMLIHSVFEIGYIGRLRLVRLCIRERAGRGSLPEVGLFRRFKTIT